MRTFKIYSFYTQDSVYKDVLNKYLIASLNKLNKRIPFEAIEAENFHHWGKNVAQKPLIISQLLDEGLDNIVFLDADATVEQYPQLFHEIPNEYDIAFHYLDWDTWYQNNSHVKELLTGTMYFRNNEKVRKLCAEWYAKAEDGSEWEQQILEKIIKKYDLKIYELPLEYIYIKTLPQGIEPNVKIENPVIIHHQVSRQLKKGII